MSESRAPHAHGSMAGPYAAELTGGSRAGFVLSSPHENWFFFLHQSVLLWQPGRFPPFWFPHEAVFCTEVLLHSLGRGFGVLERVPVCCSSSWGHIPSWSSGDPDLPAHRGFDPHLPARACGTALVHAGTGGSHPAPFGVVKSVLSVPPSSRTVCVTVTKVK